MSGHQPPQVPGDFAARLLAKGRELGAAPLFRETLERHAPAPLPDGSPLPVDAEAEELWAALNTLTDRLDQAEGLTLERSPMDRWEDAHRNAVHHSVELVKLMVTQGGLSAANAQEIGRAVVVVAAEIRKALEVAPVLLPTIPEPH